MARRVPVAVSVTWTDSITEREVTTIGWLVKLGKHQMTLATHKSGEIMGNFLYIAQDAVIDYGRLR